MNRKKRKEPIGLRRIVVKAGLPILMAGVVMSSLAPALPAAEEVDKSGKATKWMSMFNGKDLTGWEGESGWWEVRDGVLVTESTPEKPCKRSHYLYWKGGEPGNFEMRFDWRLSGQANSGVQFRSETRPQWDAWGYQADLDTAGVYTGCLYQHVRGLVAQRGQKVRIDEEGKKAITTFADPKELLKTVRPGDWNEYRVRAVGHSIALWINGVLMCEVDDFEPKFALPKGIIALQMHQGPPMKAEFKNLRIQMLPTPVENLRVLQEN